MGGKKKLLKFRGGKKLKFVQEVESKAKFKWTIMNNGGNGEKSCWKVERGLNSWSMLWKFDTFNIK